MAARKKIVNIPFDIPIPILLDEHFTVFKYRSYSRGYHTCKELWNPLLGDDSLICQAEESNEHDKYAVEIVFDDCLLKRVVGRVPLYWSKLAFMFIQFQNHSIRVAVIDKRVNRGAVLGPEIPADYFFMETVGSIPWRSLTNALMKK